MCAHKKPKDVNRGLSPITPDYAVEQDAVALRVRDNSTGGKRRTLRLPGAAFVGRFLLHVLPRGFKRIRHYGLLGPAHKRARLAAAREALQAPVPKPVVIESVDAFMRRVARREWSCCPQCHHGRLMPVAAIAPQRPWQPSHGPP